MPPSFAPIRFRSCLGTVALLFGLLTGPARAFQDPPAWRDVSQDVELDRQLDLEFARYDERVLHLDLFSPLPAGGPRAGIVLIHGGGWLNGDKTKFHPLAERLARYGFVVAAMEYRLGGEAKFPAAIEDCHAAVRYLRGNARRLGVDPKRIAAVGGSAGGHLAGLLAATADVTQLHGDGGYPGISSRIQAAIVLAGPLDLATGPVAERSRENPEQSNSNRWLGKTVDEAPELYRLASATTHFSNQTPPILFQTGDQDAPWRNAAARGQLLKLGVATGIEVFDSGKHGCWNRQPWQAAMVDRMVVFLRTVLGSPGEIDRDGSPWLTTTWGEIRRGEAALVLQVAAIPSNGVLEIPRLNNPIGKVLLRSDSTDDEPQELVLTPGLDRWSIRLPKNFNAASAVVDVALVGAPSLPTIPAIASPTADGQIVLPAHLSTTHGELLRYEPQPHKNTVGYWANPEDIVQWRFYVEQPGDYEVEILQGCGKGQGGSEVVLEVGPQRLPMTVEDTGHFQNFQPRKIGVVHFEKPAVETLTIRVKQKAATAVMDVRQVKLIPQG